MFILFINVELGLFALRQFTLTKYKEISKK
jgi:hypothetical protein